LELSVCGHVAIARAKVEDITLRVEEDLAGTTSKAKAKAIVLEGFTARFAAGVEVGGNGRW
jgi:hypothetical protein